MNAAEVAHADSVEPPTAGDPPMSSRHSCSVSTHAAIRHARSSHSAGSATTACVVLLATGGRIGEILALRWAGIDLDATHPQVTITGEIYDEVQIDGIYLSSRWCCLIAITGGKVIAWQWCDRKKTACVESAARADTVASGGSHRWWFWALGGRHPSPA